MINAFRLKQTPGFGNDEEPAQHSDLGWWKFAVHRRQLLEVRDDGRQIGGVHGGERAGWHEHKGSPVLADAVSDGANPLRVAHRRDTAFASSQIARMEFSHGPEIHGRSTEVLAVAVHALVDGGDEMLCLHHGGAVALEVERLGFDHVGATHLRPADPVDAEQEDEQQSHQNGGGDSDSAQSGAGHSKPPVSVWFRAYQVQPRTTRSAARSRQSTRSPQAEVTARIAKYPSCSTSACLACVSGSISSRKNPVACPSVRSSTTGRTAASAHSSPDCASSSTRVWASCWAKKSNCPRMSRRSRSTAVRPIRGRLV